MRSCVAICTKDRPAEVERALASILGGDPSAQVLVIDASADTRTARVCGDALAAGLAVEHVPARRPGLARQRNEAVQHARRRGAEVVHFIDDDVEICSGYFTSIENRFEREPGVIGVGGVILNQPRVRMRPFKWLFLLWGRTPGSVLRSGRNVLGQYPSSSSDARPDWLSGCSMSFRMTAFGSLSFDDRMSGYSYGEDLQFSFRLSRSGPLAVEPTARCYHHIAATARIGVRARARASTLFTHQFVLEHRHFGLRLYAFWWSTVGDMLLQAVALLVRPVFAIESLRGVAEGTVVALRTSPTRLEHRSQ